MYIIYEFITNVIFFIIVLSITLIFLHVKNHYFDLKANLKVKFVYLIKKSNHHYQNRKFKR